jgi:hypothetical protein
MNKDVTLIVFEGLKSRHEQSGKLFKHLCGLGGFGDAVYIAEDCTYQQAMHWELGRFSDYFDTSHALVCTHDGFISNPHLWQDSWLEYDMVGAPWPAFWNVGHRVGNTGFTLQSQKFLQMAAKAEALWKGEAGDVFLCRTMEQGFRDNGIKYAPVDVAAAFSWEHYVEENTAGPDRSFGFHGWVAGKTREQYYTF